MQKTYREILLDRARNELANLCGFLDWGSWELNVATVDDMLTRASEALKWNGSTAWRAVVQDDTAFTLLFFPYKIRSKGEPVAHDRPFDERVAGSVLTIDDEHERTAMTKLYRVVFSKFPIVEAPVMEPIAA